MKHKSAMDREHWLALSPYLDQALDLPIEQLESWILQLESSKPDVGADVRRLLAFRDAEPLPSFLNDHGVMPPPSGEAQYLREGELLGSYRVLRELGRGGMAVVYLAERADGHFEQHVALKVLRFGTQGTTAQNHFAQERQILASLHHPAIARLIDGGITPSGMHYLAMEYVDGLRIDRYCDEHRLRIEDRLRLFLKVADAVQYAHRRLIVHRDLKPSNIVVTADGSVKLLDFGIAKLLDPGQMAHAAPPTLDVIRLMTPEYASPEQARGAEITTATDIYQLGLLLYELLTSRQPYNMRGHIGLDALRVICESEPMRLDVAVSLSDGDPAQSLDRISAARATTPERLRRLMSGDLTAIVFMTLRKEPERRYDSVGQLMEDIVRYLDALPVHAYKGLWGYRAGKFVRRHAASVTIFSILTCTLVFVIVWYTVLLARERDTAASEALRARREEETAQQISSFLTTVLRGSSSRLTQGDTTARTLLDRGAEKVEKELARHPYIQARLLNVIGDAYAQYDVRDKAQSLLERALIQNTRLFGPTSKEVADTKQALGKLARNRGELQKARGLFEEALSIRERSLGPRHLATADALYNLTYTFYRLGESRKAVQSAERALEIYTRSADADQELTLTVMDTYALSLADSGELIRAREMYEQLIPRIENTLGPTNARLASALINLANSKLEMDDFEGVEPLLLRSMAIQEQTLRSDHSSHSIVKLNLGLLYYETGRFHEAQTVLEQVIARQARERGGPSHEFEAAAREMLGRLLQARGDMKNALVQLQSAKRIYREALGDSHWRYSMALRAIGDLQMELGQLLPAAAHFSEALTSARRAKSAATAQVAAALVARGQLLARTEKSSECEAPVQEALDSYRKIFPQERTRIFVARGALGECLLSQGKLPEAERLLRESIQQLQQRYPSHRRMFFRSLIRLYRLRGDQNAAQRAQAELAAFSSKLRVQ